MKLTTKIAYSLLPSYVWGAIRRELYMSRLRWRNRLLTSQKQRAAELRKLQDVRVHLGCGKRIMPGWVNLDCFAAEGIAYECDFRDPLPFSDNSVQMLYCEHVIEHLQEEDVHALLRECRRVLAPGAPLRIGAPDGEIYIRAYMNRDEAFFQIAKGIGGPSTPLDTPMKIINQMARMGGHHHYVWDFETLSLAMERAGFQNIAKGVSGSSRYEGLCLDDPDHAFETLYAEAEKP